MLMYNTRTSSQSQVRNFKQTTAPAGATLGDLWVDVSASPPVYKTLISQYPDIWAAISSGGGGGGASVVDHGQLTGLGDDDHTQYLTNTRGDARYYTKTQVDSSLTGKASVTHNHDATYQPLGSYALSSHNHDATYQPLGSYSLTSHNHDSVYQPLGSYALSSHNHDTIYASITHDHTGVYQPAGSYALSTHNHDSTYQPIGSYATTTHNHDTIYASITHSHAGTYQPVGSYLTANQTITVSGDASGSGTTSIPLTLSTVNSNVGTFTNATITVDAKGRITAASTGSGGGGGGSPGGSDKQVQFNNSGAFAGAANVQIDNGDLNLAVSASPVTPTGDAVKLYGRLFGSTGGRMMPSAVGPSGMNYPLQPAIWRQKISRWNPAGNSTGVPGQDGTSAMVAVGTATSRSVATTNALARAKRLGYVSSTTAGNQCGHTGPATQYALGDGTGFGGFFYSCRFGVSDAAIQSVARTFVGVTSSIAAPTNVDPATLTNAIGIGHKESDTNWFIYFGGSAAQTRIDLGANFPINTADLIDLTLWSPPNQNGVIYYDITRISTSGQFVASGVLGPGTAGTTLPATSTFLAHRAWRTNNTAAAAVGIDISHVYFETDW